MEKGATPSVSQQEQQKLRQLHGAPQQRHEPVSMKTRLQHPASKPAGCARGDEGGVCYQGDVAMGVMVHPGEASKAAAAAATNQTLQQSSPHAAAAGVAAAVRAATAAGEGSEYADPAAAAAAGRRRDGTSRRGGSHRAAKRRSHDVDDDCWIPSDDEEWREEEEADEEASSEGLSASGGWDDDDSDGDGDDVGLQQKYRDLVLKADPLVLKEDHHNKPLWVCSDGRIFLETYSPIYKQASDFLIAVAEPVCRPESIHEYMLTPQSLFAAVSTGLDQHTILHVLDMLSKAKLSSALKDLVAASTCSYGRAKLVLKHNRFWVETADPKVLEKLLNNPVIHAARVWDTPGADARGLVRRADVKDQAAGRLATRTMEAAAAIGEGSTAAAAAAAPAVAAGNASRDYPSAAAAAAGESAAGGCALAAAAAAATCRADNDDGLPGMGGMQRQTASAATAAAAGAGGCNTSSASVSREGDLKAAAATQDGEGGSGGSEDTMQLHPDQQQQQQQQSGRPRPARRGRLAAVAAVAAATNAAAGDSTAGQALTALHEGSEASCGYEEAAEKLEEPQGREVVAFEIKTADVERVKKVCLPGSSDLNCPLLEEYYFAHDRTSRGLDIELQPGVQLRPYQQESLSKALSNGRARSGVIALPCGAGKTLVGVAAAARIKKPTLVLCNNTDSVTQWAEQFRFWTNVDPKDVVEFISHKHGGQAKEDTASESNLERMKGPCVCVTTYNMIVYNGKRNRYTAEMMHQISNREWGLLVLDEVHAAPANSFRQVIAIAKAHCKLGLTATLVREDDLIKDLNFLIGPKMYEANWQELTRDGHIAKVGCVEAWCPMTPEFLTEYRNRDKNNNSIRQLLAVMNPNKFILCQYLINWREQEGHKVIVISDNVWALETYARALNKPYIHGKTPDGKRTDTLTRFKAASGACTLFLSKVGDTSIDIPDASVLIQISSHGGSRRQETQRLGRILRAKKGQSGSDKSCAELQANEPDAFFYTLVSRQTKEEEYTARRQQYLVDQGYALKILPAMHAARQVIKWRLEAADSIKYGTQTEQQQLLERVINSKQQADTQKKGKRHQQQAGGRSDVSAQEQEERARVRKIRQKLLAKS